MSKSKKIIIPVKLAGWKSSGVVLSPKEINQSKLIDLIEDKNTLSVSVVVEQEEPKVIQMTEAEFVDLISVVDTYAHPVAELKSRFKHRKYHKRD